MPYLTRPRLDAVPVAPRLDCLVSARERLLGGAREFARDVLPLIEADARIAYRETLAAHPGQHPSDLDLDLLRDPLNGRRFETRAELESLIDRWIAEDTAEAELGTASPRKNALSAYGAARALVEPIISRGGISGTSFEDEYRGYVNDAAFFASGPPHFRAHQLLALRRAGIVGFLGPGLDVRANDGHWEATSSAGPWSAAAPTLIEAWLRQPDVYDSGNELIDRLAARGGIRAWRHPDGRPSRSIDTTRGGRVIAEDGALPSLFTLGLAVEDTRVFTVIAPIPGTDSSVLREISEVAEAVAAHLTADAGADVAADPAVGGRQACKVGAHDSQ